MQLMISVVATKSQIDTVPYGSRNQAERVLILGVTLGYTISWGKIVSKYLDFSKLYSHNL